MSANTRVREFFDNAVAEWDTYRYRDETYVARARIALHWLKPRGRRKRVLDLGCGTGHQTLTLLARGDWVVAVDFSEAMARAARQRAIQQQPSSSALVVVADAMHLPFRAETFDAVLALGLVGFVKEAPSLLERIHSLIAQGGMLVCDAGVPEEEVLLQRLSRTLSAAVRVVTQKPQPPLVRGWYSQNFQKYSPVAFERLLASAAFKPVRRGGGGFGELRLDGDVLMPWRLHVLLTRILSWFSALPWGSALARRALTYVVLSRRLG